MDLPLNRRNVQIDARTRGKKSAPPRPKPIGASADLDLMIDRAKQASDFLKALSHESRLLILCILSKGEKSVTDLEQILSMRQSAVSQQLARLRLDGLVETKRDGKTIYYSLANDDVRRILDSLYEVFCKPTRGPRRRAQP
jgi:DNA-binding transcriptional ArsR family regulator